MTAQKKETIQVTPETAFCLALVELKKVLPKIDKPKTGQEGHREFEYAPLDHIMDKINGNLCDHGFGFFHQVKDSNLVTTLFHVGGHAIQSEQPLGQNPSWKQQGAAITYASRYNVLALLNLTPTGEDNLESQGSDVRRPLADENKKAAEQKQPPSGMKENKDKPKSFQVDLVNPESGDVQKNDFGRSPAGIKAMIEPFEASLETDPTTWAANRNTLLELYQTDGAGSVEIFSPAMGNMTFKEWCETLNQRCTAD